MLELRGRTVHTAVHPTPMHPDGIAVVVRVKRNGTNEPVLFDLLREARLYASQLAWDNRPSKFSHYAVRTKRRVRYGVQVLRQPGGES
jgi:hypothetical protein